LRAIEQVRKGERVWARDLVRGEWRLCEVADTFERDYDGVMIGAWIDGELIQSTDQHPWWVISGEDLAARPPVPHVLEGSPQTEHGGRWVQARDLRQGDVLLLRGDKTGVIGELHACHVRTKVYNFAVAEL
jgi:hypothetical protein